MIYDKTQLLTTAKRVKTDIEKGQADAHKKALDAHKKALAEWESRGKQKVLDFLAQAVKDTKANKQVTWPDTYGRPLPKPPETPTAPGCSTQVVGLVALIELLNTLADDVISPNALSASGFKDVSRLLRRPCP